MSRIPESFQSGGEQRRRFFSADRRSGSLFLGHEKARKKISRSRTALNRRALSRSTRGSCSEPSIVGPAAVERIAVRRDHGEKRPEKTEGERNEARGGASEQRDGKKQATTTTSLWRGMKGLRVTSEFKENQRGGTGEFSPRRMNMPHANFLMSHVSICMCM